MSDPQPLRLKPKPRRAEPLQPDKPGSGNRQQPADAEAGTCDPDQVAAEAAEKEKLQAETALDNVRHGYD